MGKVVSFVGMYGARRAQVQGMAMQIRDLGELEGTVLVFGGACSNLQATRELFAEAARLGIPPSHCICTGDSLAYCADPVATLAAIRDFGCPSIAGNVERQLAARAGDCGCNFAPGSTCKRLSETWYSHADAAVSEDDRAWMADLPDWIVFSHEGRTHLVLHGGGTDVSRYLWPVSPLRDFRAEWEAVEQVAGPIDVVISGHSGLPFIQTLSFGDWINAGAIGMPPNDGDPRGSYAVLSGEGPSLHRLEYDHEAAAWAMEDAGLTQGYHDTLRSGYWPSEDVLPTSLRRSSRASG